MSTYRPTGLLVAAVLILGGCAGPHSGNAITAASSSPFMIDPASLPTGRVTARDPNGQDWTVTVVQSYYAASEQVCMNALIGQAGSPASQTVPAVLCKQNGAWRVSTPLRTDSREASVRLPERLVL